MPVEFILLAMLILLLVIMFRPRGGDAVSNTTTIRNGRGRQRYQRGDY
jgi:hypothetical protein